jgi:hypothetical protein
MPLRRHKPKVASPGQRDDSEPYTAILCRHVPIEHCLNAGNCDLTPPHGASGRLALRTPLPNNSLGDRNNMLGVVIPGQGLDGDRLSGATSKPDPQRRIPA